MVAFGYYVNSYSHKTAKRFIINRDGDRACVHDKVELLLNNGKILTTKIIGLKEERSDCYS